MRPAIFLSWLLILNFSNLLGQQPNLFPIRDGNKWGYIDANGKVRIKPKYQEAHKFSEGLAAVQTKGLWGYINSTGKFEIKPKYHYAMLFSKGKAIVVLEGNRIQIDKKGTEKPAPSMHSRFWFRNGLRVEYGHRHGMFEELPNQEYADLWRYDSLNGYDFIDPKVDSSKPIFECGILQESGKWLVPYGDYKKIEQLEKDYFEAERVVQGSKPLRFEKGWIDHKGIFYKAVQDSFWVVHSSKAHFNCGVAVVPINSKTPSHPDKHPLYGKGIINIEGKLVSDKLLWYDITPFSCNRAFARRHTSCWKYILDTKGNVVSKDSFAWHTGWENGEAIVLVGEKLAVIDTMGRYVVEPFDAPLNLNSEFPRFGNLVFGFKKKGGIQDYGCGFLNVKTKETSAFAYQYFDTTSIKEELFMVRKKNRLAYVRQDGREVWLEKPRNKEPQFKSYNCLESFVFSRLHMYPNIEAADSIQRNIITPRVLLKLKKKYPTCDSLFLYLQREKEKVLKIKEINLKSYIVNFSTDTIFYSEYERKPTYLLQALDKDGKWRDIEVPFRPGCIAERPYSIKEHPGSAYMKRSNAFGGPIKTLIRIKGEGVKTRADRAPQTIYSNPIEGSINPGQFWRSPDRWPYHFWERFSIED